jgi:predicted ester cyclase
MTPLGASFLPVSVENNQVPTLGLAADKLSFAKATKQPAFNPMNNIPPGLLEYIAGLKAHDVNKIATAVGEDLCFITQASTVNKERFLSFLRALYAAFPDWHYDHYEAELRGDEIAVKWRQSGTHSGTLALPGMIAVPMTGKKVTIPEQYFFYRVRGDLIVEIRPDPIAGGAPQGISEQIGVEWLKS